MLHIYEVSVTTNCGVPYSILTRAETQEEAVENIFQLSMGIGRIEGVRCIRVTKGESPTIRPVRSKK